MRASPGAGRPLGSFPGVETIVAPFGDDNIPALGVSRSRSHGMADVITGPGVHSRHRRRRMLRLMRVYRETIDGREGEMATRIDRPKRQRMIDLIYRLRDEACALTGLR